MVELGDNGCCLGGFMIGLFVVLGCIFFFNISWFDLLRFENLRKFERLACMEIWVHGFFFFNNFFERKIINFLIL